MIAGCETRLALPSGKKSARDERVEEEEEVVDEDSDFVRCERRWMTKRMPSRSRPRSGDPHEAAEA